MNIIIRKNNFLFEINFWHKEDIGYKRNKFHRITIMFVFVGFRLKISTQRHKIFYGLTLAIKTQMVV